MAQASGWGNLLFGHFIAFVFCVAFPGFVTAVAPVSWIQFQRHGENVCATSQTCLFFILPYSAKTVDPVVGVGDHFVAGQVQPRTNSERSHRSEDEAFLVIHGRDQSVEVPVTPFNIKSVTHRAEAFLSDPNSTELRMTVVANWKFSVFAGGLVSLLTVLYVVGMVMSIYHAARRLCGLPG